MRLFHLPPIEDVLFVHYHCDEFGDGDKIYKLTAVKGEDNMIHCWDADDEKSEINAIEGYYDFILTGNDRKTIVSWNQTFLNYGPSHINDRYYKLTGKKLNLIYHPHIELSNYLWNKYGNNYIEHPRLDSLARKNNFLGIRSKDYNDRSYISQRIMLIVKIYGCELKGELKVNSTPVIYPEKSFKDFLLNSNSGLKQMLYSEFKGRKGKSIAVILFAINELGLLSFNTRKELLEALRNEFGEIGSNESINKYLRYNLHQLDNDFQNKVRNLVFIIKKVTG